jgi:hypothetical protein
MSGQSGAGAITTLEDLFLSREFGRPAPVPREPEDVFLHRGLGGRWRAQPARNRAFAAVSGVAASALVAAGFAAGTATHAPAGVSAQAPVTHAEGGGGNEADVQAPGTGPGATTPQFPSPASATGAVGSTADLTAFTVNPVPNVPGRPPSMPAGTTFGSPQTPPYASSPSPPARTTTPPGVASPAPGAANPLTPVVTVVTNTAGTVVGNAVSTASSTLATTVPSVTPVTTVVGNLGSAAGAAAPL